MRSSFTPDNKFFISIDTDNHLNSNIISVWSNQTNELYRTINEINIIDLCCTPNNKHIVVATEKYVRIWNIKTGLIINTILFIDSPLRVCTSHRSNLALKIEKAICDHSQQITKAS